MATRVKTTIAAIIAFTSLTFVWWKANERVVAADRNETALSSSASKLWVLRLHPGDDLVDAIMEFSRRHSIQAGGVVTCVGSLSHARLRFANQKEYEDLNNKGAHFEIVSLVGTFSTTGGHFHLSLANEKGEVFGGHANSGNKIYTTAELIIVEGVDWMFRREQDPVTGYKELFPVPRNAR